MTNTISETASDLAALQNLLSVAPFDQEQRQMIYAATLGAESNENRAKGWYAIRDYDLHGATIREWFEAGYPDRHRHPVYTIPPIAAIIQTLAHAQLSIEHHRKNNSEGDTK